MKPRLPKNQYLKLRDGGPHGPKGKPKEDNKEKIEAEIKYTGENFMTNEEILNLKIDNSDFDKDTTIKDYLKMLLLTVWEEEESFSGKRPFGNSGWKSDLDLPLVRAGLIGGTYYTEKVKSKIQENVGDVDTEGRDNLIARLIKEL